MTIDSQSAPQASTRPVRQATPPRSATSTRKVRAPRRPTSSVSTAVSATTAKLTTDSPAQSPAIQTPLTLLPTTPRTTQVAALIEGPRQPAFEPTMLTPPIAPTPQPDEHTLPADTDDHAPSPLSNTTPTPSLMFELTIDHDWGTLLCEFPPSHEVAHDIYACEDGLYLLTHADADSGNPVNSVCWANSDHWAERIWSIPPFRGKFIRPDVQSLPPNLEFLGRPGGTYRDLVSYELSATGAKSASDLLHTYYRIWDSQFAYTSLRGAGITYYFSSPKPGPDRKPVAITRSLTSRHS
jgi:hypothetical protein